MRKLDQDIVLLSTSSRSEIHFGKTWRCMLGEDTHAGFEDPVLGNRQGWQVLLVGRGKLGLDGGRLVAGHLDGGRQRGLLLLGPGLSPQAAACGGRRRARGARRVVEPSCLSADAQLPDGARHILGVARSCRGSPYRPPDDWDYRVRHPSRLLGD